MIGEDINATDVGTLNNSTGTAAPQDPALACVRRDAIQKLWLAAGIALFLVLGFVFLRTTGNDDCYMTYWPAHTLARYGRIINYNGEAVEQSSSLLWVLILALSAVITRAPVPLLGPALSIIFGAVAVFMAACIASRLDSRVRGFAVFLTATTTYLLYWSFSGMETSLAAVCTAWLTLTYSDYVAGVHLRKVNVFASTLCCVLVRPEMGAVLCALLAGLVGALWVRRHGRLIEADQFSRLTTRIGFLALVVIGICMAVAAVRIACFHMPIPEPVVAKSGGLSPHINQGVTYLVHSCSSVYVLPAVCLALLGIFSTLKEAFNSKTFNMTRLVCALLILAYCSFIAWVGGDWMRPARFMVPFLPLALILAAYALARFVPAKRIPIVGLVVVLVQMGGVVRYAMSNTVGTSPLQPTPGVDPYVLSQLSWFDRSNRMFLRDAAVAEALDKVVSRMLATGHPIAHIFTGQAGIVMYTVTSRHFGRIDLTDRHGLVDRRMASCSLAEGRARLTNGLSVDYAWYLTHRSDLERVCHIPSPDILYDMESLEAPQGPKSRAAVIQKHGYALVYHRVCDVPQAQGWLRGYQIARVEFIAVRRDLLPSLGFRELTLDRLAGLTL